MSKVTWTVSKCIHGKTWMPTPFMLFYVKSKTLSNFSTHLSSIGTNDHFLFRVLDINEDSVLLKTEKGEYVDWNLKKSNQISFLDLIQKNDCLGFIHPILNQINEDRWELEFDLNASVLLKQIESNDSLANSKDYLKESKENKNSDDNIHIYGRVMTLLPNHPLYMSGNPIDRYGLQIIDESETPIDITLWDDLGRKANVLQTGQIVFISHLSRCYQDGISYINGTSDQGTRIQMVSSSRGILSSPFLFKHTYLKEAYAQHLSHFYTKCIIVAFAPKNGAFVQKNHIQCRKSILEHEKCRMCECNIMEKDIQNDYLFYISIDDGSKRLLVLVGCEIGFKLLGRKADSFLQYTLIQRKDLLEELIGIELQASIIWNGKEYEIDCIV